MNQHTKIKHIVEVSNVAEALLEVSNILKRLRETTKFWEEHYGATPKVEKKRWEAAADKWLSEHTRKIEEDSPGKTKARDWGYSNKDFE